MDNLWILILVIIICVVVCASPMKCAMKEGFANFYKNNYKEMCGSCSSRVTEDSCLNCLNCGISYGFDGRASCVPGDSNGPFFRQPKSKYYAYGKQWRNKIIAYPQVQSNYPYNIWHQDHKLYLV